MSNIWHSLLLAQCVHLGTYDVCMVVFMIWFYSSSKCNSRTWENSLISLSWFLVVALKDIFISLLSEVEISGAPADGNKFSARLHSRTIFIIFQFQNPFFNWRTGYHRRSIWLVIIACCEYTLTFKSGQKKYPFSITAKTYQQLYQCSFIYRTWIWMTK